MSAQNGHVSPGPDAKIIPLQPGIVRPTGERRAQLRQRAAEYAWQRAANYARKVNDRRQLAYIVSWLASAALWGPTPAPEGIKRCMEYLDEIGNHPIGKVGILLNMAGLYAMQDEFAAAQETLNTAKQLMLKTLTIGT